MNINNLRTKLTKDFTDFYGEEALCVINDYCDNDNDILNFIISDTINRSGSRADTLLLNILKKKLNFNDFDKELHAAFTEKLSEIQIRKSISGTANSVCAPFDFIRRCDSAQVLHLLGQEMPQTIAVVLSFMEATKAAVLLKNFPREIQSEVAKRIALLDAVEPETIREIEKILEKKLSSMSHDEGWTYSGGVESIVEILNLVDRSTENQIIETLEDEDPELAEEIKKRLFVFNDIVMLDDRAIQKLMREVDSQELAKALKGVDFEVQDKIFINMSKRAAGMLKEDMEYMGPVRIKDIEEAQSKIIAICKHLEDTGEIIIARANEDEILVDDIKYNEKVLIDNKILPYDSVSYLLAYSKKEVFEKIDNDILAVSLFGTDKNQRKMVYKKLNFKKKLKVKGLIKKIKEIWYDDIRDAQLQIIEILKKNFDENDIDQEANPVCGEILKD